MAALSTLAFIAGGALVGALAGGAGKKQPKPPALPAIPEAPKLDQASTDTSSVLTALRLRKRSDGGNFGGTLLTGPSGLTKDVPTQRKTLLGS